MSDFAFWTAKQLLEALKKLLSGEKQPADNNLLLFVCLIFEYTFLFHCFIQSLILRGFARQRVLHSTQMNQAVHRLLLCVLALFLNCSVI